MRWEDDRPSWWRSRTVLLWFACIVAASIAGNLVERELPDSIMGPVLGVSVLALGGVVFAAWQAGESRRRWLVGGDPFLAEAVERGVGLVALPPQEAVDAVLGALRAIGGAQVDLSATSVSSGHVRASTGVNLLTLGERLEVALHTWDDHRIAVFATCIPRYRNGPAVTFDRSRVVLTDFFAALPLDRPAPARPDHSAPA